MSNSTGAVHRFSSNGLDYLGDFATSPGSAVGTAKTSTNVYFVATSGPFGAGAVAYDLATLTPTTTISTTSFDALHRNGELYFPTLTGSIERYDLATSSFLPVSANIVGFGFQMVEGPNDDFLLAEGALGSVYSIDRASGATVAQYSSGLGGASVRGVAPLGNGNILFSGELGVHTIDPATGTVTPVDGGDTGWYITPLSGAISLGTNYCTPAANSTGAPATISAVGSAVVSDNILTLVTSNVPSSQFGLFLCSQTQAFVPGASGTSDGNLCLGGSLGRIFPVVNAGASGGFSLTVDLTALPQGAALVPAQPGEDWNFQAWFRDSTPLGSNFTDGLEITFQ